LIWQNNSLLFFLKYFHTIRFLKWQQIFFRIKYKLLNRPKEIIDFPKIRKITKARPLFLSKSVIQNKNSFKFLNKTFSISVVGWNDSANTSEDNPSKLWRYNQHYFDFFHAPNFERKRKSHHNLMENWITENPPSYGVGWEPYPISLRTVNWIKWHIKGNKISEKGVNSIAQQINYLDHRIEYHILGNHLFSNAKALVFAGLFFTGDIASRWLKKGLEIISKELKEQVLDDGGNFERSTMYHSIFLEDLLDLIHITDFYPGLIQKKDINLWKIFAQKMLSWIDGMSHPDKEISFFNDAALNIASSPRKIFSYANSLNIKIPKTIKGVQNYSETGFISIKKKNISAFLDVGKIGPDYLPGHGHADTLSFELSLFEERVFVNGGVSLYESGEVRDYERSTAAHNTVVINNENSSEVWSSFRVARRAYPFDLKIKENQERVMIYCSHNGYHRLKGKPTHTRNWIFKNDEIIIKDQIQGRFNNATANFHLHPSIKLLRNSDSKCFIQLYCGKKIKVDILNGNMSIKDSFYSPEFGIRKETKCLAIDLVNSKSELKVSLLQ